MCSQADAAPAIMPCNDVSGRDGMSERQSCLHRQARQFRCARRIRYSWFIVLAVAQGTPGRVLPWINNTHVRNVPMIQANKQNLVSPRYFYAPAAPLQDIRPALRTSRNLMLRSPCANQCGLQVVPSRYTLMRPPLCNPWKTRCQMVAAPYGALWRPMAPHGTLGFAGCGAPFVHHGSRGSAPGRTRVAMGTWASWNSPGGDQEFMRVEISIKKASSAQSRGCFFFCPLTANSSGRMSLAARN